MVSRQDPSHGDADNYDTESGTWVWDMARPLSAREVSAQVLHPRYRNGNNWRTPLAILGSRRLTLSNGARHQEHAIDTHPTCVTTVQAKIDALSERAATGAATTVKAHTKLA